LYTQRATDTRHTARNRACSAASSCSARRACSASSSAASARALPTAELRFPSLRSRLSRSRRCSARKAVTAGARTDRVAVNRGQKGRYVRYLQLGLFRGSELLRQLGLGAAGRRSHRIAGLLERARHSAIKEQGKGDFG
jgi:hypothetical protein